MDPGQTQDDIPRTPSDSDSVPVDEDPKSVEEFSIRECLGRGGFGRVFLAYDNTLQREVALKIPHARLVGKTQTVELYLREARAIASLDHPCIIPVYRASKTPQIPCYIVTKRIRGCHLGQWHARNRPSFATLARVLAQVADALAYAHKRGVVHRDIKPGNILIDENDHPYVADFGLALRDVDPKGGPTYVGTPAYMSPEQARGEGHRVDGRSDVYSMGVLLYELLTGSRPFRSSDQRELCEAILYTQPEHPCHVNSDVPTELASICLKCLAKGIADRYQSADLLAAELRAANVPQDSTVATNRAEQDGSTLSGGSDTLPGSRRREQPVVPKGLRPFDMRDAEFYLRLLPGPRDREGVPEIVRFWTSRIEPGGSDQSVPVGLIYGPSGCGKTSLVRAGLIPRLSSDVTTVYLQAGGEETERKLARQIASRLDSLGLSHDPSRNIVDAFATLRRQRKKRTVIFIDQFEQWLFTHPDCNREPLTQALRQCDGQYLQCILMVRDDFWMGVTRLMQALDLTIAENVNVTAVDLFDVQHARNVLRMFGAAYGRLPEPTNHLTPNQSRFLDAAVDYLSADGRVICVQLALLTEMLKDRAWDKTSRLFRDGGTDIGMQFFDETFDSEKSPRRIRMHADGTLRVLRALLPESGSRIKGAVCSEQALFQASGYGDKQLFRQLISILDRELHLITPTDRSDTDSVSGNSSISGSMSTGFQLTHDFLIAPIRQWVEYQNRSSREGKARLRLEEFADLYEARPRPQSLPTIAEYLGMRRFVSPSSCNESQRKMMSAALKRHLRFVAFWLLGLLVLGSGMFAVYRANQQRIEATMAKSAVARLLDAKMGEAVELSHQLSRSQLARHEATRWVDDEQAPLGRRVRAALVVADAHPQAAQLLADFALDGSVEDVVQLARRSESAIGRLSEAALEVWNDPAARRPTRIRAACLLANDPQHAHLLARDQGAPRLVKLLVTENPVWIGRWGEGFEPVAAQLISPLVDLLSDPARSESSLNGVNLLIQYAGDDPSLLSSLLPTAHRPELIALTDALAELGASGVEAARELWQDENADDSAEVDISQPWGSPWWCVGARVPLEDLVPVAPLPDRLQHQLVQCESAIAPHAILSHKVSAREFDSLARSLAEFGYRGAEIAPYETDGRQWMAALWIRDGVESRFVLDATSDQLRAINQKNRSEGFLADSVTAYRRSGDDLPRYAGVWIGHREETGLIDSDIYIDVPDDKHESDGWAPMAARGLGLPRSNFVVGRHDDRDYFTSVRWKTQNDVGYRDRWNMQWDEFQAVQKYGRALNTLMVRASLQTPHTTRHGATTIWWMNLPVETKNLTYQGRREHLRRAKQQLGEGFFPVSIHAAAIGSDPTPQFCSTWWRGRPQASEVTRKSNRLRNLVLAHFRLGRPEHAATVLAEPNRGALRGAVISGFHEFDLDPQWLVEQTADERQPIVMRRSCAMALSLYDAESIPQPVRDAVAGWVAELDQVATDPGLRSAIEAIATGWGWSLDAAESADTPGELRSIAGDRLVIIDPHTPVWLGSPGGEPGRDPIKESEVPIEPGGPYAIATREVTVAQYLQFRSDHGYAKDYAQSVNCPIINVNWFEAARYCRWLSEQEGIPESQMCYPRIDQIKPGMQLDDGFDRRMGYRLPTEAEWEHACRGGVERGRWFGFDPQRLAEHAWTTQNSGYRIHPVGQLLPNDFGLFDMLGNASEWCHSTYDPFPTPVQAPITDPGRSVLRIESRSKMINRGGANLYQPLDARAAQREFHGAEASRVYITFRIARAVAVD